MAYLHGDLQPGVTRTKATGLHKATMHCQLVIRASPGRRARHLRGTLTREIATVCPLNSVTYTIMLTVLRSDDDMDVDDQSKEGSAGTGKRKRAESASGDLEASSTSQSQRPHRTGKRTTHVFPGF